MAKTRLLRTVAMATMLVFLISSVALADGWVARTRVTIKVLPGTRVDEGTDLVVKGKLKSRKAWCRRNSQVVLREYGTGVLDRDRTDRKGRYRFEGVEANEDMQLRVWFGGKRKGVHPNIKICRKSRSRTVAINVT